MTQKTLGCVLGLLVVLMVGGAAKVNACAWTQKGTWAKYTDGTLKGVEQDYAPPKSGGIGVSATGLPIKAQVRYGGQSRPISEASRDAIANYARARQTPGLKQQMLDLFTQEFLFIENGVAYWLPFQKQMIPYLKQEVAKDDPLQLMALWVGYTHPQGKTQHTFLVNEFCKS